MTQMEKAPMETIENRVARTVFRLMSAFRAILPMENARELSINLILSNAENVKSKKNISEFEWLKSQLPSAISDVDFNNVTNILLADGIVLEKAPEEIGKYALSAYSILEISENFQHATSTAIRSVFNVAFDALDFPVEKEISVLDPAVGSGMLLAGLIGAFPDRKFDMYGQDINPAAIDMLSKISFLTDSDVKFECADVLHVDAFPDKKFDLVVIDPPLGMSFNPNTIDSEDSRFGYGIPNRSDAGWLFIQHGLSKLKSPEEGGGTLIVTTTAGNLFKSAGEDEILERASRSGLLQAIVALPEKMHLLTHLPLYVLVFSNRKTDKWLGKAQLVNLRADFDPLPGRRVARNSLSTFGTEQLKLALRSPRPDKRIRTISHENLRLDFAEFEINGLNVSLNGNSSRAATIRFEFPADSSSDYLDQIRKTKLKDVAGEFTKFGSRRTWEVLPHFAKGAKSEAINFEVTTLLSVARGVYCFRPNTDASDLPIEFDASRCLVLDTKLTSEPRIGSKATFATTNLSEIWVQVEDENLANYILLWFKSDFGRTALLNSLESANSNLKGSMSLSISQNKDSLLSFLASLVIPKLSEPEIREANQVLGKIGSSIDELKTLKDSYITKQVNTDEVEEILSRFTHSDVLGEWAFKLPFPLAASLQAYRSLSSDDEKAAKQLVHFWEASAIFLATYLLSALRQSDQLWVQEIPRIRKAMANGHHSFERASIGTWNIVIEYLSTFFLKAINRNDSEFSERYFELLGNPSRQTVERLLSPQFVVLLNRVIAIRNHDLAHGGTISTHQARMIRENLEALTNELQAEIKNSWTSLKLIRAGTTSHREGGDFNSAQILMAPTTSFVTDLIPVSSNLYEGELYLVTDKGSVRLLPLVQMGAAPKEALSTCYFYSRLENNGAELVTYQFSGQDKMTDNSSALLRTISDIISLEDSPIENL